MDDRKRNCFAEYDNSNHLKRTRPEDQIVPEEAVAGTCLCTRLCIDRLQFSRVIGKSGGTIASVRSTTGAKVRVLFSHAEDINLSNIPGYVERDKMVVHLMVEHSRAGKLVGPRGATIQQLKQQSGALVHLEKEPKEVLGVQLRRLSLEGTMAAASRAHADIVDLLSADITLTAERGPERASPHPGSRRGAPAVRAPEEGAASATFLAMSDAFGQSLPADCDRHPANPFPTALAYPPGPTHSHTQTTLLQAPYNPFRSPPTPAAATDVRGAVALVGSSSYQPSPIMSPAYQTLAITAGRESGSAWTSPLSASALLSIGVPAREVGQLVDLQTYLLRNFGLELAVARAQVPQGRTVATGSDCASSAALSAWPLSAPAREVPSSPWTIEEALARRQQQIRQQVAAGQGAELDVLYFAIPSSCVGGVIGQGGKGLRELQREFGVRVYVEKEDYLGQRIVSLTYVGHSKQTTVQDKKEIESEESEIAVKGKVKREVPNPPVDDLSVESSDRAPAVSINRARSASEPTEGESANRRPALPAGSLHKRNRTESTGAAGAGAEVVPEVDWDPAAPGEFLPRAVPAEGGNTRNRSITGKRRDGDLVHDTLDREKSELERKTLKLTHSAETPAPQPADQDCSGGEAQLPATAHAEVVLGDINGGDEGEDGEHGDGDGDDRDGEPAADTESTCSSSSSSSDTSLSTLGNLPAVPLLQQSRTKRKRSSHGSASPDTFTSARLNLSGTPPLHPPSPQGLGGRQGALQRCKERIEALVEDILQKRAREVDDGRDSVL